MKTFFKEIFEYHHHFNQALIKEIDKHLNDIPERSSLMFCHMLNAHQIWNARIMLIKEFGVHQTYSLEEAKNIDSLNYKNSLKIISDFDLSTNITYSNSKGDRFVNTVQDILFHATNHHTHHRAQIISDFRQSGITPLATDYIFYKR